MEVADIIERLGGATRAAEKLGVKRSAVTMWRLRQSIPRERVPDVAEALGVDPGDVWPRLRAARQSASSAPETQEAA